MTDPNTPQGPLWSPPPATEPRPADALPAAPAAGAPGFAPPATPAPAAPGMTPVSGTVRGRNRSGMLTTLLLAGALVVATAGVAFAVGRVTAPASSSGARGNFGANGTGSGQFPTGSGGAGGFRGGPGQRRGLAYRHRHRDRRPDPDPDARQRPDGEGRSLRLHHVPHGEQCHRRRRDQRQLGRGAGPGRHASRAAAAVPTRPSVRATRASPATDVTVVAK